VSHPTLGLAPIDLTAAFPDGAARIRASEARIAARALETAIDHDPTLATRYDEDGLRHLLRDASVYLERIALAVASGETHYTAGWAEWVAPLYRRRRVPMDDLINISEGLRRAVGTVLSPEEQVAADAAIDAAIKVLRWHRRLAGDARKRNPILWFLYKGAEL
jgi:hypothetical protein